MRLESLFLKCQLFDLMEKEEPFQDDSLILERGNDVEPCSDG